MVAADLPIAAVRVFQGLLLVFYLAAVTMIRYRITRRHLPARSIR